MRPHESGGRRLLSNAIALAPPAAISWAHDVAGNAVQAAVLQCPTEVLVVESVSRVEPSAAAHPVFAVAASAITFLFRYTDDAWMDLGEPDGPRRPGRLPQPTGLGRAVRRGLCDRYFIPAQRPERRGRRCHRVPGPGRRRHAIPERDPDIADGLTPRPWTLLIETVRCLGFKARWFRGTSTTRRECCWARRSRETFGSPCRWSEVSSGRRTPSETCPYSSRSALRRVGRRRPGSPSCRSQALALPTQATMANGRRHRSSLSCVVDRDGVGANASNEPSSPPSSMPCRGRRG